MDEILWPSLPFDRVDSLLYVVRRGSESHNTYIAPTDPNSVDDRDIYALCIPPRDYYTGLSKWEHAEGITTADDGTVWDVCIDEVRKFASMLYKCNPNVVSALWARDEDKLYVHPLMRELIESRHLFLSKQHGYNAFAGYAEAQFNKMRPNVYNGVMGDKRKKLVDKYGYDCKNAAHCIRLLHMGIELLRDGEVNPWRTWDRDMILEVKTGKWPLDRVLSYYSGTKNDLSEACDKCTLPASPDFNKINEIVTRLVWNFIQSKEK